jgi:hypothetical protein
MPEPVGHFVKKFGLLDETDIGEGRPFALLGIARHDPRRMPDQKDILARAHEASVDAGDHVERHVLLVEMRLAARRRTPAHGGHLVRIILVGGNDLVPHRVVDASHLEIGGVEGLVPRRAITARRKGIHHRGRKVPRPGPHGDIHAATSSL